MGLTAWDELQLWVAFTTFGCIAAHSCNFLNHREDYAPDKTSGFAVDYI